MSVTESQTEVFAMEGGEVGETQIENSKRAATIFENYIQPCVAELVGTTVFVFVGCLSVVANLGVEGSIQPAVAHGLALGVVIAILGKISGGHFNPAVSVSVFLSGGLSIVLLVPYIVAQLLGAMTGAGLVKAVAPSALFTATSGGAFNTVTASSEVARATVAEMIMSFFLSMSVCMGAVNNRTRSELAPLCIGLTVTACVLAGSTISGACMNPARALGPAVASNYWEYHWIYWVGPMCGALITGSLVRLLLGDQKTRVILK